MARNRSVLFGFMQKLLDQQLISLPDLEQAILTAKQHKQDIVAYLVEQLHISDIAIAQAIAQDLALPLLDLNHFAHIPNTLIDEKLILQYRILPLSQNNNTLTIASSNPSQQRILDIIQSQTHLNIEPIVVEYHKLEQKIQQLFSNHHFLTFEDDINLDLELVEEQIPSNDTHALEQDTAPIVKYVNKLLLDAIRMGASDLHFEPYEKHYRVRYRIDGLLKNIATPPLQLAHRISSRIKVMSQMDIAEKRMPQDGRIKLKVSAHQSIDFRVSSLPTLYGEKLVLRILNSTHHLLDIDYLGLDSLQKQWFMESLQQPQGMILITGPTGSGKTVSLYTALHILNQENSNISTVEDPVEIYLEGVNQVNINPKIGLDFATVLRALLRQDPDIIMLGEIRDVETAEIAIKASQTGHKVLSTLHTNSAMDTLIRLKGMGIASFNIATSVQLIIAQRLARKLCPLCKTEQHIPKESLLELGFTQHDLQHPFKIYTAKGCKECNQGYKGRIGIYEVLKITPDLAQAIMQNATPQQLYDIALSHGFYTLQRAGLIKVMQGITSLQEINRIMNHH